MVPRAEPPRAKKEKPKKEEQPAPAEKQAGSGSADDSEFMLIWGDAVKKKKAPK
jgi:hypothetical protein